MFAETSMCIRARGSVKWGTADAVPVPISISPSTKIMFPSIPLRDTSTNNSARRHPQGCLVVNLSGSPRENSLRRENSYFPWQCLYFLPLPQGHGSLRPTLGTALLTCTAPPGGADPAPTEDALGAPPAAN